VHARLAAALDEPDERALHVARATIEPDEEIAAALEEAADRSGRRHAAKEAVELAAQAVRLTPPGQIDALRRRAVAHAVLVGQSGDTTEACAMLRRLAEETPEGAERSRVLLSLAGLSAYDLIPICEEALAHADEAGRPRALFALSGARWSVGDFAEAARLIDEAVPLAEASGDRRVLAFALYSRGWMQWSHGGGVPEELLRRAIALLPPTELRPILESHPEHMLATILLTAAEYERARPLLERQLRLAQEHGDERIVSELLAELGYLEARIGHVSRAEELVEAALDLARQLQEPAAVGWAQY
jgi:tetratricopeptide (TPR) repeat protein